MRTFSLALSLLWLAGCPQSECPDGKNCIDSAEPVAVDSAEEPCDPSNAAHTPDTPETCDGVDNNCNGEVDEGLTLTIFPDLDQDGFGDASATAVEACEVPDGWVETATDCDDADHSVFPGAEEFCDHVDNDCDGEKDEDVGVERWVDGDDDGYGAPGTGTLTCDGDAGFVENDDDCDDTNPGASPASEEVCDEVDNDCDGTPDDGVTTEYYADLDGDGYGDGTLPLAACVQPTGYAATGDDCDDTLAAVHPDADETCDGVDEDCDGAIDEGAIDAVAYYADADSDGYGSGAASVGCTAPAGFVYVLGDCDDGAASVNPAATELCNGVDDDCNGTVDEDTAADAATWYGDADGDGFGGTGFSQVSCAQPAGYVASADDCDDLAVDTFPGAPETCDGTDEDCDGVVDNDPIDLGSFYMDGDSDGYGEPSTGLSDCSAPAGYVADNTDCDDAEAGVHPGALETCDGVDEDCDTLVDDGVTVYTWYIDADGDGYGIATSTMSDCATPAGYVAADTDCDDGDSGVNPGVAEVCDGVDQDCNGLADEGLAVSDWYLDNDGDGFGDAGFPVTLCSAPAGYIADDTDCDDLSAGINPAATETCDGVDEDCDGSVDDGVPLTDWYVDADGDGYGDNSTLVSSCASPAGYVDLADDCDDADPLLFPEADGVCPDGLDCKDIQDAGKSTGDGTYTIDPDGSGTGAAPFDVLCNTSLHGGGWTQAIQAFLDSLDTSTSHTYLYSYGSEWYVSPSTTVVWSWSSYSPVDGTYGYGSGPSLSGTFGCTHAESGHWGVGCSNGGGGTYKVLPIYASDPALATSTICQDRPDVFGAGACRSGASIWVRD
jgi:hypothetical protein